MEDIIYYSNNGKKPPFKVNIKLDGHTAYINCDCQLGLEKKICRHKINAIRADKENRHPSTSDEVISRLKFLFGTSSTLRQHLEEKWKLLREFISENSDDEEEISNKRRILGEAFANGFLNESAAKISDPFDIEEWEGARETLSDDLKCLVTLKYINYEGAATTRDVIVEEIFTSNSWLYLLGYCNLRKERRTFRIDRIQGVDFGEGCTQNDKNLLLNVLFQGNPSGFK